MKTLLGIFIFLIVFALAGLAMHYAMYNQPGLFIWSLVDGKKIVQTKLETNGFGLFAAPEPPKTEEKKPENKEKKKEEPKKIEEPLPDPVKDEEKEEKEPEKVEPPVDPNVFQLFDGKDLGKWEVTQFGGEGEVFVTEDGELELGFGAILTGVHWKEKTPRHSNYEITLEAMKLDGVDFFCALTFPVKESHASFVVGGWGGGVVGISSVDDLDASENETMNIEGFNEDVWYKIRVRVTDEKIEAWIDDDQKVDLELKDRKISLRPGDIELCVPLGIASFQTRAKFKNIVWTNLPPKKDE